MNFVDRQIRDTGERLPALMLAIAATLLVFAAINAGFTPHATALAEHSFGEAALAL
jgi:hypothetical protein